MSEWITTTVLVLSFVMLVVNSFLAIYNIIQKAKEPTTTLDTRVDNLERMVDAKFKEYDSYFDRDLRRIKKLEEGNIVMIEALQALLKHSIDDNNIDELKDAEKKLTKYLIERGKETD